MIGRIHGQLLEKAPPDVLVDAGGVGYELQLPMTSFYQLPAVGETCTLYTHFVVREDAQLLFGFADKLERGLFRELIKANGVGPKLGLAILSGMSAKQFLQVVQHEDVTSLTRLPGIGKKTAERMLLELKDKVGSVDSDLPTALGQAPAGSDRNIADTVAALEALGSKPAEAQKAAKAALAMLGPQAAVEELVRAALKGGK